MIPLSHPVSQYRSQESEINSAILRVLQEGRYILGHEVDAFEKEFAAYLGASYAVGVANGTEALQLALLAVGVGPQDEVISVSHTAIASVSAIRLTGATPVLLDVDPFFTLDVKRVEAAITSRTKAVVAVHIYGQPVELEALQAICRKHSLVLVEDCAQATGATYQGKKVGSIGQVSAFSFYPTKNLGAIGDGGMVVTSNQEIATKVRRLREYGWDEHRECHYEGMNSRLDEIQAAILRVKLKSLDEANAKRFQIAEMYYKGLSDLNLELPQVRPNSTHVFHLYVIRSVFRDKIAQYLKAKNIGTGIHYAIPAHLQPGYRETVKCPERLDVTEKMVHEILSLPMYPELTQKEIEEVIYAVRKSFE